MARIRTIKPEAFTSESLSAVPVAARWTFFGLLTMVDDEGRCRDEPRLVKAHVYALDDDITAADVRQHLDALEKVDCIRRYQVGGRAYLYVTNFRAHQKINRPTPSKIPPPPPEVANTPPPGGRLTEPSVSSGGALPEDSPLERKGKEGKGTRASAHPSSLSPHGGPPAVLEDQTRKLVDEYASHCRAPLPRKFRADLYGHVDTAFADGFSEHHIRAALQALHRHPRPSPGLFPSLLQQVVNGVRTPLRPTGTYDPLPVE